MRKDLALTEPFDTDSTSELPDAVGAANATTTDYIRYVRWREREKESRAIRMVELLPPTRPLPEFRFFGIV